MPVMLVGNKCDEEAGKREVNTKTGEALQVFKRIYKKNIDFFQTQSYICFKYKYSIVKSN